MKKLMRDRMERFVVLPFSFGCASKASVELGATTRTKAQDTKGHSLAIARRHAGEERHKMKNSSGFLALPKPNIAGGIRRLISGFKSLSQLFFYKDVEEMEPEMEIGFPTDVKHLTHIGLDGSTNTNHLMMGWDNLKAAPELLSLSTISLKQFELAMAAQAHQQTLVTDPSSKLG
ncbi:hypothetical protein L6164_012152 [Bauhinia variegata]|uniref:Uncharacterized protein n=1 Tax=Bauhinia variegata TaxID=167791 RepID=A0ACB9P875_BAUVA|nr:hypothetical protein L6164_012152 [Bauhinia variegata]